jgi:hypothetical protein
MEVPGAWWKLVFLSFNVASNIDYNTITNKIYYIFNTISHINVHQGLNIILKIHCPTFSPNFLVNPDGCLCTLATKRRKKVEKHNKYNKTPLYQTCQPIGISNREIRPKQSGD